MEGTPSFWQFSLETVLPRLAEGMSLTLQLTLLSGVFGIALGMLVALARIARNPFFKVPASLYVTVIRGTPLLLQVLVIYFAIPPLVQHVVSQMSLEPDLENRIVDLTRLSAYWAGVLALSINAGAYFAEIFRAGIQSIEKGQMEAARALGMAYPAAMRRIILPQTFRRLIPPVVNELAALAKDTSLVSVISLSEMLYIAQRLGAQYLRPWEIYFWTAIGYLLIVVALSTGAGQLEKRLAKRET